MSDAEGGSKWPGRSPLDARFDEQEAYFNRRAQTIDRALGRLTRNTYTVLAFLVVVTVALGSLSASLELKYGGVASDARRAAEKAASTAISSTQDSQHQLCHRLNKHRAADNQNAYSNWKLNVLFANAVAHPPRTTQPQTPEQKALTAKFLVLIENDVAAQTWTPLTRNCTTHPGAGAEPVHFGRLDLTTGRTIGGREPSPGDLTVGPGE